MRKFKILAPILGLVAGLLVVTGAQAALVATQSVGFTVVQTVGVTCGAVALGNISSSTTGVGTCNLNSNDTAGFDMTSNASAATYLEAGTCAPTKSVPITAVKILGSPLTGFSSGTAGVPVAQYTLGVGQVNVFNTRPTGVGAAMVESITYTVDGLTAPINTAGCSYTVPVTWTVFPA